MNKEGAITYSSFFKNVMGAAKDTATTIKRPTTGWFEENKELLKPPIKEKHSLHAKWRSVMGDLKVSLLERLRAAGKVMEDKVTIAKANWSRGKAEQVRTMNIFQARRGKH